MPYADLFADPARGHPWDRAAMTVLAETVRAGTERCPQTALLVRAR